MAASIAGALTELRAIPVPADGIPMRLCFAGVREALARRDGPWLSLEITLHARRRRWPTAAEAWRLLARNAALSPGVKYTVDARRRVHLRAEALLHGQADDARATLATLAAALDGVPRARPEPIGTEKTGAIIAASRAPRDTGLAASTDYDGNGNALEPDALTIACSESGWPLMERSGGAPEVALADRHAGRYAQVTRHHDDVRAMTELLDDEPHWASPVCRHAAGVFLLRAGAAMRLVRAAAPSVRGQVLPLFETYLPTVSNRSVDHAFGALSTAVELCGREFAALAADPAVAQAYLSPRLTEPRLSPSSSTRGTRVNRTVPATTEE